MHQNSLRVFERFAAPHFPAGANVLEIGPSPRPTPFQEAVSAPDDLWHFAALTGVDSVGDAFGPSEVQVWMPDEYTIPVPDGTYDVVFSGNVLEHVRKPWRWMPELARVTKPGGLVVTVAPLSWPYHEVPVDCWRIYPEGMRALSEDAGLEVVTSEWAALQPPSTRRHYPGESYNEWSVLNRSIRSRLQRLIGWPMPTAYDTCTVARKPLPGTSV